MAQRRMFSIRITNSARFLKMPHESQALYFHLCMRADDDGIVEAFSVMKSTGANDDAFKVLVVRKFVIPLNEDDVAYIMDWNEHNLIRADRKVSSIYKDLLVKMLPEINIIEPKPRADTGVIPRQIPTGRPLDGIGKDRLGKDRLINKEGFSNEKPQEDKEPLKEVKARNIGDFKPKFLLDRRK